MKIRIYCIFSSRSMILTNTFIFYYFLKDINKHMRTCGYQRKIQQFLPDVVTCRSRRFGIAALTIGVYMLLLRAVTVQFRGISRRRLRQS